MALAGQPAAGRVSPLWGGHRLPLLAGDCSTLCGQVRPPPPGQRLQVAGASSASLSHREPQPAGWTVYTAALDPVNTLFAPAHFVSQIVIHEGYDSQTRTGDIALMRLTKPLDFTGERDVSALRSRDQETGPTCRPCSRRRRGPSVPPQRRSKRHRPATQLGHLPEGLWRCR